MFSLIVWDQPLANHEGVDSEGGKKLKQNDAARA